MIFLIKNFSYFSIIVFLSNNVINSYTHVKLGDFGLARVINNPEKDFAQTYVG